MLFFRLEVGRVRPAGLRLQGQAEEQPHDAPRGQARDRREVGRVRPARLRLQGQEATGGLDVLTADEFPDAFRDLVDNIEGLEEVM